MQQDSERHTLIIKLLPHPQFKGDWLVECRELLPYGLRYKSRENAIGYAKLLGKECSGEVRVLRGDGSTEAVIALPVRAVTPAFLATEGK